jgi:Flp pilus assembly protein TadD
MSRWIAVLLAAGCVCYGANDKVKVDSNESALIDDGKKLEASGSLLDARKKYQQAVDAGGKKARKELARLDETIAAKTKSLVDDAAKKNMAKDYAGAVEALKSAAVLSPQSMAAACNLPVVYQAIGDIRNALDSLDRCIQLTTKKEERLRREELRTELLTGEKALALNDAQKEIVQTINEGFSENSRRIHPDSADSKGDSLCTRLLEQKDTLPKSSSILFNLARCSENQGKVDDAARFMEQYLASSDESGKDAATASELADLKEILAQPGAGAEQAKVSYGRALQLINTGRLSKALEEYQRAIAASPGLARAQWRLALFYENMGDVDKAREAFTTYQGLVGEDEKKQAQAHLDALNERADRYSKLMSEIRADIQRFTEDRKQKLANPKLGLQELKAVSLEANQSLQDKLQEAVDLFPLAAEPNRLLGYQYLQQDRAAAARGAFDALSLHESAPFFYATVNEKGRKGAYAALIQVESEGVRVLPLSEWDKKAKKSVDLSCKAKEEASLGLANVIDCGEFLPTSAVSSLEVKNLAISVKTAQKEYTLMPQNVLASGSLAGGSGPTWRKYSNRYARLFSRYMAMDGVKLGKEGFTGMEKFGMVMEVASVATGNLSSISRLTSSTIIITGALATLSAFRVIQESRMELRNMLQIDNWKAIPVNPEPLAFRLDLR